MAKYLGPKCKLSRRECTDLLLKSSIRDHKSKCKSEKLPGQHGGNRSRLSEYGVQLREKQKIKRLYGVLEKQFRLYYYKANKKLGSTGENLISFLERRLDNIVYRMGFASTRAESRQLVNHRAILVNKRIVNIPSYLVNIGDVITIHERANKQHRIHASIVLSEQRAACHWLSIDKTLLMGKLISIPTLHDISHCYNINLVVELYSK